MNKIPVFSIIKDIYKETFCDIKRYGFLIWFWALIIGASAFFTYDTIIMTLMYNNSDAVFNQLSLSVIIFTALLLFISAVASILIITTFLRSSLEERTVLTVEFKDFLFIFFIVALATTLIFTLFMMIGGLIAISFNFLISFIDNTNEEIKNLTFVFASSFILLFSALVVSYISTRISLIFPDIYAKNPIGITRCWLVTKGNFGRLFLIFLIISIPFIVLNFCVPTVYYDDMTGAAVEGMDAWVYSSRYAFTLISLMWAVFLPLIGTMLAKIYKYLVKNELSE